MTSAEKIQAFIIKQLDSHPHDIVAYTIGSMNITRTTVRRHLNHLIKQGKVFKTGTTKNTFYALKESFHKKVFIKFPFKTDEFEIFKNNFLDSCSRLPKNVNNICHYGITEMINNAIDHANAKNIIVEMHQEKSNIIFTIQDDGIGIFKKISEFLHFNDLREAILQLNKGKFTSDAKNHSGEGIFFTSRAFDSFSIISNEIEYTKDNSVQDWFIKTVQGKTSGTFIKLSIDIKSSRNLTDTFTKFQEPDTLIFNRTEITVELSKLGDEIYVARSQAKRILINLEPFSVIILDFKGVQMVGQGFADEVFRVYHNENPQKEIRYINASDDVDFMVKRAIATANS